jgi:hypothetical protein
VLKNKIRRTCGVHAEFGLQPCFGGGRVELLGLFSANELWAMGRKGKERELATHDFEAYTPIRAQDGDRFLAMYRVFCLEFFIGEVLIPRKQEGDLNRCHFGGGLILNLSCERSTIAYGRLILLPSYNDCWPTFLWHYQAV